MKLFGSLLVVGLATALPLLPVTAHAQRYTQDDPLGDVQQAQAPSFADWTTLPEQAERDIVSTTSYHRKRFVRVEITFRELTRTERYVEYVHIRYGHLKRRDVKVTTRNGLWRGRAVLKQGLRKIRCDVRHDIDYEANRLIVRVPRSCLGYPRWVRVADTAVAPATGDLTTVSTDYGGRDGVGADEHPYAYVPLVFAPKLRRG